MSNRKLPIYPDLDILTATRDAIAADPETWCTGGYTKPGGYAGKVRHCAVGHLMVQIRRVMPDFIHMMYRKCGDQCGPAYVADQFLAPFGLDHDTLVTVNDSRGLQGGRGAVVELLTLVINREKEKLAASV